MVYRQTCIEQKTFTFHFDWFKTSDQWSFFLSNSCINAIGREISTVPRGSSKFSCPARPVEPINPPARAPRPHKKFLTRPARPYTKLDPSRPCPVALQNFLDPPARPRGSSPVDRASLIQTLFTSVYTPILVVIWDWPFHFKIWKLT